jgi:hypothetical protein
MVAAKSADHDTLRIGGALDATMMTCSTGRDKSYLVHEPIYL